MNTYRFETSSNIPPCSRCAGELLLRAEGPKLDRQGNLTLLELCRRCDIASPAAGALLRFFAEGGAGTKGARRKVRA
ncbi:DUF6300 family protein [Streptomyces sp. NPDC059076]|uniref:DUF6300 family protein n=1 Tax=unclassified Streptomyces TaxID=2593676 RepID=UPI003685F592